LKKEGLALNISAGYSNDLKIYSSLDVKVELTKKGMENYETILATIFSYAKNLSDRSRQVQETIFNEIKTISQLNFDFASKGDAIDTCTDLASEMQEYSDDHGMKHLLRAKYGPLKIDSERIEQLANLIADPCNCVIFH
jgi:insulysin